MKGLINIPNTITCLNLISGCIATYWAFQGDYEMALLFIVIGAVFDFFDGMAARLLGVSSPVGKELDSLADIVTFGVAPSAMVFSFLKGIYDGQGPRSMSPFEFPIVFLGGFAVLAFMMAAFSALRLAKFNLDRRQTMGFIGLPTPANALFWGALIVGCGDWLHTLPYNAGIILLMVFVSCWLLVSEFPMFALKFRQWGWHGNEIRYLFLLSCIPLLVFFGVTGIAIIIVWYVLLSMGKWERFITRFLTVAVVLFAPFVLYHIIWWQPKPDRDSWSEKKIFEQNMSILPYNGIDISQEQGYIDWQSVSMDRLIEFVYLKATEGASSVDSRYMTNVAGANNYGFLIGSYHRFTSDSSVEQQFFNFNKHVERSAQRLLPMVEIDDESIAGWSEKQFQDSLVLFAWLVNDFYGSLPVIKTTQHFFETQLSPRFEDYPLFISDANEHQPLVNARRVYIWRRIEQGTIPGIVNDVSLDSFTFGTSLRDLFLIEK